MKERLLELVLDCAPTNSTIHVSGNTNLIDDLDYDSLCIISLFTEINNEFGINVIAYKDIYLALQSFEELYQFVKYKIKEEKECRRN